ncbi:MAG TPA: hypothetical protein VG826_03430 [Pirellulales bacterium]|nr:hypothetical protein [Pirellulales bacterium]
MPGLSTSNKWGTAVELRVNLKFGSHQFTQMPFMDAVQMIHNWVVIERSQCEQYLGLFNQQHWIVSGISSFVSGATPPTDEMWEKPLDDLIQAMQRYQEACSYEETRPAPGHYSQAQWEAYQKRSRLDTARFLLECSVSDFNKVHKAWYDYRSKMEQGAEAARWILEMQVLILTTAATAGAGGMVTGAARGGLMKFGGKALVQGAGTLWSEGAKAVGLKLQKVEDINYLKLAEKVFLAMVGSKFGDALSKHFLSYVKPQLMLDSWTTGLYRVNWAGSTAERALAEFLGKGAGKAIFTTAVSTVFGRLHAKKADLAKLKMEDVFKEVLQEMVKNGAKEALKAFLKSGGIG